MTGYLKATSGNRSRFGVRSITRAVTRMLIAAMTVAVLLTACATAVVPAGGCDTIGAAGIESAVGASFQSEEDLRDMLSKSFPHSEFDFRHLGDSSEPGIEKLWEVLWRTGGVMYRMAIEEGVVLWVSETFEDSDSAPSLGAVVECIGAPDQYVAWYGDTHSANGMGMIMDMLYTEEGISLYAFDFRNLRTGSSGKPEHPEEFSKMKTYSVLYLEPMSAVDMLKSVYSFGSPQVAPSLEDWYYSNLKKWGGAWDRMDITVEGRP